MEIHGKLVDVHQKRIFGAKITIEGKKIAKIEPDGYRGDFFILPGFIDAHTHIESSLLPPSEFAKIAVRHGSIATVSNPRFMAQVLGTSGVDYMLDNARKVPFKFFFGDLSTEKEVTTTLSEAREKHHLGMKVLVCEGSVAKNFYPLFPLLQAHPESCFLCTGDLTPDSLVLGHINLLVKKAVQMGMDPIAAITCATKSPAEHYGLDTGLLREGDPADFILVEDLRNFRVFETYINGECIFKGRPLFPRVIPKIVNRFQVSLKEPKDFALPNSTENLDLLKLVMINRYKEAPPVIQFVKNFGLKKGALASSCSSDSQNIIAIGVTDTDLCQAVNALIESKGGLVVCNHGLIDLLPLPIGGILSNLEGEEVARRYSNLVEAAKSLGTPLKDPFLTLAHQLEQVDILL